MSNTAPANARQRTAALATLTIVGGTLVVDGQPVSGANFEVSILDGTSTAPGSLRHAITQASMDLALDTITFAPGLNGTITTNNVLGVKGAIDIVGNGDITLSNLSGEIFYVYDDGILTMSTITLDQSDEEGIINKGVVRLDGVDITESGTSAIVASDTATLTYLDDVEITGATDDAVTVTSGDLTIKESEISGNDARGVFLSHDDDTALVVENTTINSNGTQGMYAYGTAAATRSATFSGVTASDNGDGGLAVFNFGDVDIDGLTVERNDVDDSDLGGLVVFEPSTVTVNGLVANDNGPLGAQIYEASGAVDVSAVTVAGNAGPGLVLNDNQSVSISDVTAVDNGDEGVTIDDTITTVSATNTRAAGNAGGGLYIDDTDGSVKVDGFSDDVTVDGTNHLGNGDWSIYVDNVDGQDANGVGADVRNVTVHGEMWISEIDFPTVVDGADITVNPTSNNALSATPYPQFTLYDSNGDATVRNVTITGSTAEAFEVYNIDGEVTVESLTITDAGLQAINVDDSNDVTFTNITVGDNDVTADHVIRVENSTVEIAHSTISANTSDGAGTIGLIDAAAALTLDHSIVAGNDGTLATDAFAGSTLAAEFSLVETGSLVTTGSNVETTDPDLGPLADNGGSNQTMLPNATSPAVDAGDPTITTEPATDQRGLARIVPADSIDIGAVEVDGGEVNIAPVTVAEDAGSVDVTVTRVGTGDGPASIDVFTSASGTATPGEDFENTDQTVAWTAGEVGPKVVTIPILSDGLIEGDETIVMSLSNPVGTRFGTTADVTITDVVGPAITSLAPQRFADTRPNGETFDDIAAKTGKVAADSQIEVQIAGRGGIPANAVGVVMNVTAIGAEGVGFVTAHGCVEPRPLASSLNYTPGVNLGNEVIAGLSADGKVCLYTSATANLAVDVVGYIAADSPLVNVEPSRVLDTRTNGETVDDEDVGAGKTTAGETTTLKVAGRANVPADAAAVIVNVTAIGATTNGFVTVSPCVTPTPTASSLNHVAGVNRGNELVASLDADGQICLFTSASVNLAVDVVGYLPAGSNYSAVDPARFLDTRDSTKPAAGDELTLPIAGVGSVPAGAAAVVLNVTAVAAEGTGFVTVHPCQSPRPLASSLNYVASVNGGNEVIAQLNTAGEVCLFTSNAAHLTVDVVGYLT